VHIMASTTITLAEKLDKIRSPNLQNQKQVSEAYVRTWNSCLTRAGDVTNDCVL